MGENEYVMPESQKQDIAVFEYPPGMEETAIERVRQYKSERDNTQTEAALARVREEAERVERGEGDLLPALIEAARTNATMGEMMTVLREVFGWGYSYC